MGISQGMTATSHYVAARCVLACLRGRDFNVGNPSRGDAWVGEMRELERIDYSL
jgi:hypothetical protein